MGGLGVRLLTEEPETPTRGGIGAEFMKMFQPGPKKVTRGACPKLLEPCSALKGILRLTFEL